MNRNVESYFSTVPSADISRSSFDRSQDVKMSFNVGNLVPFYVDEVLPGDTFSIETSKVVRLQTLLTPVMDNIYLDTYFFFVPNRLVWTHWREFMGENTKSAWLPDVEYSIPQITCGHVYDPNTYTKPGFPVGSTFDFMGVPVGVDLSINALPFRAYQLIFNEWFRDENLQDPENIYLGDALSYSVYTDDEFEPPYSDARFPVAKYHDYFTSCLPAPLKGEPVLAPLDTGKNVNMFSSGIREVDYLRQSNSGDNEGLVRSGISGTSWITGNGNAQFYGLTESQITNSAVGIMGTNLGINIMQLRNAFQVQKLLERDARSGTRYTEIIKGHFGVTSPDSRLQRPEYLGGNRIPISIHQITNQSQGADGEGFLGDLGAMSLTTDRNHDVSQSFTEHGYIIGCCCARYDHSYPQGLERLWSRKTRFDFYWPEFAHLSEQAVLNKEIFAQGTSVDNEVFGYQEAWADYRYKPNKVTSEMRPGISNSLASWHFADYYESQPFLSASWIKEDKTNVDRTLAVTSRLAHQIFCDIYIHNITTRPMPVRSIPGMADHF